MQTRLILPNEREILHPAVEYLRGFARLAGLGEDALDDLCDGLASALRNVCKHAFEPGEKAQFEVECEIQPTRLAVRVHQKGVPFEVGQVREGRGLGNLHRAFDEVRFSNLGPEGYVLELSRFFKQEPIAPAPRESSEPTGEISFQVVMVDESNVIEVCRCFYASYGYSYPLEAVYYPERLLELNRRGEMFTAVALSDTGEALGTEAMSREPGSLIVEAGMAAVKPKARGHAIAGELTRALLTRVREVGCVGLTSFCVTHHLYSQKLAAHHGMKECALLVGNGAQTTSYRGLTEELPQRGSVLATAKDFVGGWDAPLYAPEDLHDFLGGLLTHMGWRATFQAGGQPDLPERGELKVNANSRRQGVILEVVTVGHDTLSMLRHQLALHRRRGFVHHLFILPLHQPGVVGLIPTLRTDGCFLAGVTPGSGRGDARLLLQSLGQRLDYSQIQVLSDRARDLRDFIQSQDPEQQI